MSDEGRELIVKSTKLKPKNQLTCRVYFPFRPLRPIPPIHHSRIKS